MSFHKRLYNWERIKGFAKSYDFNSFDRWIFGPDAQVLQDNESNQFFKAYCKADDHDRSIILDCLKTEEESFSLELLKCINVIKDEGNSDEHLESVNSYRTLFVEKWGILAEKYSTLIK
jgi:hypothetical protein